MRLPSIMQIGTEYGRTIRRFPLVILSSITATIIAIILIEHEGRLPRTILNSIMLASILAVLLLATIKIVAEKWKLSPAKLWGLRAIGIILIIAYAFTVPADLVGTPVVYLFRFFAFVVGLILLFSVLPFGSKGQVNGFWQFNKIVVFRAILTGAFAVVLFAGLGLALAALDNLFGMNIPGRRYSELWVLINGLFTVGFILAGIPDDLDALDGVTDYPKGLRVFAQYVLAPLVLVYFVILYAYIAKIIVTWNWPQGWVGRLILGFSAAGILALFVLDPIKEQIGQSWIKRAARRYYIILLPLVVVLFLALWRRISEYGITEDRYLGLVIGLWLAVMAGYFIFSRSRSIKIIPASLCVLTFLISFGPWGMFSVSERSQISRLHDLLVSNSILVNGAVQKAPGEVSNIDISEISSILRYLREVHGYDGIQPWFSESLRVDSAGTHQFKNAWAVAEMLGIEFNTLRQSISIKSTTFTTNLKSQVTISGYDHLAWVDLGLPDDGNKYFYHNPPCEILAAKDSIILKIMRDSLAIDSLVMDLRPLVDSLTAAYGNFHDLDLSIEAMTTENESASMKAKVIMLRMFISRTDDGAEVNNYHAMIMFTYNADPPR